MPNQNHARIGRQSGALRQVDILFRQTGCGRGLRITTSGFRVERAFLNWFDNFQRGQIVVPRKDIAIHLQRTRRRAAPLVIIVCLWFHSGVSVPL